MLQLLRVSLQASDSSRRSTEVLVIDDRSWCQGASHLVPPPCHSCGISRLFDPSLIAPISR